MKKFQTPEITVESFVVEDIITASNCNNNTFTPDDEL